MAHTRGQKSSTTRHKKLAIRTRDSVAQNDIILPGSGKFISTQADRCPFPHCTNKFPHQHSTTEGKIAPSVDEFRKAGEAVRERWTDEQRRRIAENEALLHQLAEIEPKVGNLPIRPHLPRGNDLTAQEQIAIIRGGAIPAQYSATREMLLDRLRQDNIDNTSPITPVFPTHPDNSHLEDDYQTQTDQTCSLEWNDFPELDAKYGPPPRATCSKAPSSPKSLAQGSSDSGNSTSLANIGPLSQYQDVDFLNTDPQCTGPCPIQYPHNQGAYLQQGQVPRVWNARWGYSDPPREIWEAWVRVEQGRSGSWDEIEVDGFALSHWWAGP